MAKGNFTAVFDESDYSKVMKALDGMATMSRNTIVRKSLSDGAKMFTDQGKINLRSRLKTESHNVYMRRYMARKRGGSLMGSFRTKGIVNPKKNVMKAYAGFNKFGHHAHLINFGTKERYKRNGQPTGKVAANEFWSDAFDSKNKQAMNKVIESVFEYVRQVMRD